MDAYDQKMLRDFAGADGRLKSLPMQRKKLGAVLRFIVRQFEQERRYSEKQVNEILVRFHDDTASLRRGMIDLGLMARVNGEYWRIDDAVAGDPVA